LALPLPGATGALEGSTSRSEKQMGSRTAESKIKQEIFEGRFGQVDLGSDRLADFIEKDFLPWSKANKRSWRHDEFRPRTICEYFGGKTFREISPLLVERFKRERRESITVRGTVRSPASVNHELEILTKEWQGSRDSNEFRSSQNLVCLAVAVGRTRICLRESTDQDTH